MVSMQIRLRLLLLQAGMIGSSSFRLHRPAHSFLEIAFQSKHPSTTIQSAEPSSK
ncbi:hypothetical protein LINPERHAP1_LOCUS22094 [Linum perenne]